MFAFNLVRGDMHATRANVDELLAIAQRLDDLDSSGGGQNGLG